MFQNFHCEHLSCKDSKSIEVCLTERYSKCNAEYNAAKVGNHLLELDGKKRIPMKRIYVCPIRCKMGFTNQEFEYVLFSGGNFLNDSSAMFLYKIKRKAELCLGGCEFLSQLCT